MIKFEKLPFKKEEVFCSSDLHYGHKNISKNSVWDRPSLDDKCRPWDLEEMNSIIIKAINDVVPWNGLFIHMGDWSFGGKDNIKVLREQIHCENVINCYGNHDHHILNNKELQSLFTLVDHILYIQIEDVRMVLCHYPILSWHQQNTGVWNLHGHCHGNLEDNPNIKTLDVGFDTKLYGHEQYTIYSMTEIEKIMSQKKNISVDHH